MGEEGVRLVNDKLGRKTSVGLGSAGLLLVAEHAVDSGSRILRRAALISVR